MTQQRPFISRKPTKDPADLPDSGTPSKKVAADKDAARAALSKDVEGERLTQGEEHLIRRLDRENTEQLKGKKIHKKFKDIKFTHIDSAFDRHNPEQSGSFHGFFALFWLGMLFLVAKTVLQHWRETGHMFSGKLATLYRLNGWDLALTDALMVSSSILVVFFQYLMYKGLSWNSYGWILQHVWQTYYLAAVVHRSYSGNWQWIQSVFIILHCLVMLMKQHSYATYMGYLSEIYRAKNKLENKLVTLRKNKKSTPKLSVSPPSPTDGSNHDFASADTTAANQAAGVEDEEKVLLKEIQELSSELTHDGVTYPDNLTLWNYIDYLLVPSLVYDIVYPRTKKVRWWYVWEKTLATLGTFGLMTMIAEHYILPVIPHNLASMTTNQKLAELPWLMLDMVFPFIMMYLLTFYIIFECVCQWFAEVTCFADRNFYNDWWNSLSWVRFFHIPGSSIC